MIDAVIRSHFQKKNFLFYFFFHFLKVIHSLYKLQEPKSLKANGKFQKNMLFKRLMNSHDARLRGKG